MTGFMKTRLVKFSPLLAQIAVNAFFSKVDDIKTKVNVSLFFSPPLSFLPFSAVVHFFSFLGVFLGHIAV